jgi:hypothetical protein
MIFRHLRMHHSEENRDDPNLQRVLHWKLERVRRKRQKTIQQGSSSHRHRIESLALEPDPKELQAVRHDLL